ncbi:hypothetical protein Dip518_000507 [Parelusimicrobium proximum]|uniref:hypothetical protein n=1 Tax=Parelusimicrobium proximum TaxID=3228953 RepID=UPI003D183921
MLKKASLLFAVVFLCAAGAFAQDKSKMGWELLLDRASLNLTNTTVKHSTRYDGFPNSKLTADSQTLIQGYMNLQGNYYAPSYVWGNTLLAEYGRTKVRPADGDTLTTENADRILFTTDYTMRLWDIKDFLGGFEAGPFANVGYETEFTSQAGANRKQVVRGKLGAKAFEGKYVKNLYAAAVFEEDFTYSPDSQKMAWEAGVKLEKELREGVKAQFTGLFRDYFYESEDHATDIDYEFELDARMDVLVLKNLSVAPFINYYAAQAKHFGGLGQNIFVGVSFSFSHVFLAAK